MITTLKIDIVNIIIFCLFSVRSVHKIIMNFWETGVRR